MRILILNWRDPKHPNAGGAEIVTLEHAKAWFKAGNQVVWFSSYFSGAKKEEVIEGIRIIRRGGPVFGVQLHALKWYLFHKHERFDLVVDQFHGIPFFTPLYVRTKKLGFIHEVAKEVWKLNPWPWPLSILPTYLGTWAEPHIFKRLYRSTPFFTVSQSTKLDLIDWGIPEKNITIIQNGVRLPTVSHNKKEKKNTVIYLGALTEDKGITDLLTTFAFMLQVEIEWQLWIVGYGTEKIVKYIQKLGKQLQIDKNTKLWGFVSDEKKYELLQKAHVLINPSIREGWGLVILEAASQKTPAVVYNVPGLRDSVINGKTGVVVTHKTPQALADAALKLVADKKRYQLYQKECLKWAKDLTWEEATKKSLTLISRVCYS